MDVGVVGITPISQPVTLPETGGNLWIVALAMLGGGATLAGVGSRLRKQK
jgi:LPXTG-motif cell wall-anchored protein